MIQEIVRREAELQLHRFVEIEILEHRNIVRDVSGTFDVRENERPVLARRRQSEAGAIDELVMAQTFAGVARDYRLNADVRRASDEGRAHAHLRSEHGTVRKY